VQVVQEVAPLNEETVPTGQSVQLMDLEVTEKAPGGHRVQLLAPLVPAYVPGAQLEQVVLPDIENWPALHNRQAALPPPFLPDGLCSPARQAGGAGQKGHVKENRYIFQTGGLGKKMQGDAWKVWVCGAQLPCALEAHDWVCFTYHEIHDVFVPLGYNRELLIVRRSPFRF
jgi:hypothetical protein